MAGPGEPFGKMEITFARRQPKTALNTRNQMESEVKITSKNVKKETKR
jgi:hypothetical protein